jgi:hypothetical protein
MIEDDFSKNEDEIITLLNKLSSTIETFKTLSRDQAEKAILETNAKINNCKEILDKMEEYVKNNEDEEEINKGELSKKIQNYKSEYHEILNKFNEIQESYINKKTENALLEKDNDNELVDDDDEEKKKDKKNKNVQKYIVDGEINDNKKSKEKEIEKKKEENNNKKGEISVISVSNNNPILENNNANVLRYSLNPKLHDEKDEAFNQINKDYFSKKKKMVLICVVICIIIFLVIILSSTLSRK